MAKAGDRRTAWPWRWSLATILVSSAAGGVHNPADTHWFRQRSPVERAAAMQHPVPSRFRNGIELIKRYDQSNAPRQGDAVGVRLYWRATEPQTRMCDLLAYDAITGDATSAGPDQGASRGRFEPRAAAGRCASS